DVRWLHDSIQLSKLDIRSERQRIREAGFVSLFRKVEHMYSQRRQYAVVSYTQCGNDLLRVVQTNVRTKLHEHTPRYKRFAYRRDVHPSVFLCSSSIERKSEDQ